MVNYSNYSKAQLITMLQNKEKQRAYAWGKYFELKEDTFYNRFWNFLSLKE